MRIAIVILLFNIRLCNTENKSAIAVGSKLFTQETRDSLNEDKISTSPNTREILYDFWGPLLSADSQAYKYVNTINCLNKGQYTAALSFLPHALQIERAKYNDRTYYKIDDRIPAGEHFLFIFCQYLYGGYLNDEYSYLRITATSSVSDSGLYWNIRFDEFMSSVSAEAREPDKELMNHYDSLLKIYPDWKLVAFLRATMNAYYHNDTLLKELTQKCENGSFLSQRLWSEKIQRKYEKSDTLTNAIIDEANIYVKLFPKVYCLTIPRILNEQGRYNEAISYTNLFSSDDNEFYKVYTKVSVIESLLRLKHYDIAEKQTQILYAYANSCKWPIKFYYWVWGMYYEQLTRLSFVKGDYKEIKNLRCSMKANSMFSKNYCKDDKLFKDTMRFYYKIYSDGGDFESFFTSNFEN